MFEIFGFNKLEEKEAFSIIFLDFESFFLLGKNGKIVMEATAIINIPLANGEVSPYNSFVLFVS